jgi:hypothetical protein
LTLVAESTTDCLISAECCFEPLENNTDEQKDVIKIEKMNDYHFATPEDLGIYSAKLLLQYTLLINQIGKLKREVALILFRNG